MSKTYCITKVKKEYNKYTYTIIADSLDEALDNFLLGTSEITETNVTYGVYDSDVYDSEYLRVLEMGVVK